VIDQQRLDRARAIAREAGFDAHDVDIAGLTLITMDTWTTPAAPAISIPAPAGFASRHPRLGRPLLIGALAAVLVLATAFAALPQARSAVAGWFGTTTVRLPYILGDAFFLTPKQGWVAVGNVHSHTWRLYETTDGGAAWRLVLNFPAEVSLQQGEYSLGCCSIQFVSSRTWFLFSSSGAGRSQHTLFERTTDAGKSWQRLTPPPTGGLDGPRYLHFLNAADGWTWSSEDTGMGNSLFVFYRTRNGGKSWRLLSSSLPGGKSSGPAPGPAGFASPRQGWMFSTEFATGILTAYRTDDGGLRWHICGPANYPQSPASQPCGPKIPKQDLDVQEGAREMQAMNGGDYFGPRGVLPVSVSAENNDGALRYDLYMYRLDRAGAAWVDPVSLRLHLPDISSKSLPPSKDYQPPVFDIAGPNAWYFADPWNFAFTTDGGRHWTRRPSGLKTWTAAGVSGNQYLAGYEPVGIQFFGARSGYLWATQSLGKGAPRSVLRWTSNGGESWRSISLPAGP